MKQIELIIGTNTAFVDYNDEDEKENLISASKELNKEYNKLVINLGRIDETILLVFLLIKTELKLNKISSKNSDDILDNILRSISKWIRTDNEKIREFLVLINIIKKIKLDSGSAQGDSEEDEVIEKMNNFIMDIKGKIEAIEKNIVFS